MIQGGPHEQIGCAGRQSIPKVNCLHRFLRGGDAHVEGFDLSTAKDAHSLVLDLVGAISIHAEETAFSTRSRLD